MGVAIHKLLPEATIIPRMSRALKSVNTPRKNESTGLLKGQPKILTSIVMSNCGSGGSPLK